MFNKKYYVVNMGIVDDGEPKTFFRLNSIFFDTKKKAEAYRGCIEYIKDEEAELYNMMFRLGYKNPTMEVRIEKLNSKFVDISNYLGQDYTKFLKRIKKDQVEWD